MRSVTLRIFCSFPLLLSSTLDALASPAGRAEIPVQSGGAFSVPVVSMKEQRFQKTIHQQYDFSCGSAALATLLTHHYNFPVSEQDVFREMFARGDQAKIKKEGFSLLDIKNYLATHGFEADGYIAELDKLSVAGIPAIVLVKEQGYLHFVVIKGLRDGRVLIGDPSTGTRVIPKSQFAEIWANKVLFVIKNNLNTVRFNTDPDWQGMPTSPISAGHHRGAVDYGLAKRGPADF